MVIAAYISRGGMRMEVSGYSFSKLDQLLIASAEVKTSSVEIDLFQSGRKIKVKKQEWIQFSSSILGATQVVWRNGGAHEIEFINAIDLMRDTQAFQIAVALVHLTNEIAFKGLGARISSRDPQSLSGKVFVDNLPKGNFLLFFSERLQRELKGLKGDLLLRAGYLLKLEFKPGMERQSKKYFFRPYNTPMLARHFIDTNGLGKVLLDAKNEVSAVLEIEGAEND